MKQEIKTVYVPTNDEYSEDYTEILETAMYIQRSVKNSERHNYPSYK